MYLLRGIVLVLTLLSARTMQHAQRARNDDADQDRWIWGYVDVTTARSGVKERSRTEAPLLPLLTENPEPNPCSPFISAMPNFSAPGRRISDIKCYEHIWGIKNRDDERKHDAKCKEYNSKQGGPHIFAVGGRKAIPGEFPHMGAIGWKAVIEGTWVFKCGGTLISDKFLLSAAHCSKVSPRDTTVSDVDPKIVRLGESQIIIDKDSKIDPAQDMLIARVINHPNYEAPKKYYDISLIEFGSRVTYGEFVQPACLWNKPDTSQLGLEATLTGWGVTLEKSVKNSPDLQAAVVDVVDSQRCDQLLRPSCNRHWCGVRDHQLCAGKAQGGVDACQGDSGGPLQVKIPLPNTNGTIHYIIGVTSFGIGCARANSPGIYTRVSSFIDWVENIVWSD